MSLWTTEITKYLVDLYELQPCLYDVRSQAYKNKNFKATALQTISGELCTRFKRKFTCEDVKKKINGLRTQFMEAKRSRTPSGAGAEDILQNQWWLFERLMFLDPHVASRKSTSNLMHRVAEQSEAGSSQSSSYLADYEGDQMEMPSGSTLTPSSPTPGDMRRTSADPTPTFEGFGSSSRTARPKRSRRSDSSHDDGDVRKIVEEATAAMTAIAHSGSAQRPIDDYVSTSLKYLEVELRQLTDPLTVRRLIRSFIVMVQDAQDTEDLSVL